MKEKRIFTSILDILKEKRSLPLVLSGILLGTLLLILGSAGGADKENSNIQDPTAVRVAELTDFEARTEKEIELLCESVAGVSDAAVMITVARGYLNVYVTDAAGAPVTVGSGNSEAAVPGAVSAPVVSGVGIVCRGGGNAEVQRVLVELVSTTLGISANRVYVAGK